MRRFLITALLLLLTFLMQTTVFQWIALAGEVPNIILILVVSISYMRGRNEGMVLGFFAGLLIDLIYGDIVGINAILFVCVGFLVGMCSEIYYRDELSVPIILIAISDFAYNFAFYVINFLLRGRLQVLYYIWHTIMPEVVYTVLISLLVYRAIYALNYWLEKHENVEEVL